MTDIEKKRKRKSTKNKDVRTTKEVQGEETKGDNEKFNESSDIEDDSSKPASVEGAENVDTTEVKTKKRKRKRKRKKKNKSDDDNENDAKEEESTETVKDSGNDSEGVRQTTLNDDSSTKCTVYLDGLPWDSSEDAVREFFTSKLNLSSPTVIEEIRLPRWQDSGRLRGYGHVRFQTETVVQQALKLSGEYLGKRYINISLPKSGNRNSHNANNHSNINSALKGKTRTVFIGNLPYTTNEDEVKQLFANRFGEVKAVRLTRHNDTGNLKGSGYVDFVLKSTATKCVENDDGVRLRGRTLKIDYEGGRPKASFRNANGTFYREKKKRHFGGSFGGRSSSGYRGGGGYRR
eukprot:g3925.t1